MTEPVRIRTQVRGPGLFDPGGTEAHLRLVPGQPLILEREPGNPVDPCAVILRTLDGIPVGYVQRPTSIIVSALIDQGTMLLGRVTRAPQARRLPGGGRAYRVARALLWSDGHPQTQASTTNENPCRELLEKYGV